MKKYTKAQKNAIESLVIMIDELDNKPRRLFESLHEIANAFIEDETHKAEINSSIHEWESNYYRVKNRGQLAQDIFESLAETIRELNLTEEKRKEPTTYQFWHVEDILENLIAKIMGNLTKW